MALEAFGEPFEVVAPKASTLADQLWGGLLTGAVVRIDSADGFLLNEQRQLARLPFIFCDVYVLRVGGGWLEQSPRVVAQVQPLAERCAGRHTWAPDDSLTVPSASSPGQVLIRWHCLRCAARTETVTGVRPS